MAIEIGGIGQSVKRKEDARFIRGRGKYVDDVKLPGMVYLDIARSPYAHAKILKIDTSKALAIPGVLAVITGNDLVPLKLAWMPTLMGDQQMVLPTDTVMYQSQEVAAVVATERYIAADGAAAIEVEYEPLPVIVDPKKALLPDAFVLRPDRKEKTNRIWHWETGDKAGTDEAFRTAEVTVKEDIYIPRIHVSSIETCGIVASFDKVEGQLTVWMTTQAPHAIRTVIALVAGHLGLAEHKIRVISPDIDHITAEVAAKKDGTVEALRVKTIADHGAFDAAANPSKFPAGLFHIITGSYPFKKAFVEVDGAYTNKPPGGIAYRCSFRVTEAAFTIERLMDVLAIKLKRDPAELRLQNFIQPAQFPYQSALGWEYDSGDYGKALKLAMEKIDYAGLRKEQLEKRKKGELMGIGISSFTEIVGAGPSKHFDILGIKMFDSCEIRVHPTGKAIVRLGVKSQGQGHETTFGQIVAEELGIPVADIMVEEGDTDTAPYGLGTYASRSTPVAGAATAVAARKIREKGRLIAAHLLEASPEDIEWKDYKYQVKGVPAKSKTMQEVAFAAYTNHPQGMEAGLEAVDYYDPPNLTYPFGSYICVVDLDKGTGEVHVRRFVAVDDCGVVINPMIVEGQVHGGLTMGLAPALYEQINYDDDGNIQGGNFMDYLLPTAMEVPNWETARTVTPSPHHPIGAKGIGESATVGAPAAIANAVVDALAHLGVTHIDIPITPWKVQAILKAKGVAE